jgi:hypothetical protein
LHRRPAILNTTKDGRPPSRHPPVPVRPVLPSRLHHHLPSPSPMSRVRRAQARQSPTTLVSNHRSPSSYSGNHRGSPTNDTLPPRYLSTAGLPFSLVAPASQTEDGSEMFNRRQPSNHQQLFPTTFCSEVTMVQPCAMVSWSLRKSSNELRDRPLYTSISTGSFHCFSKFHSSLINWL